MPGWLWAALGGVFFGIGQLANRGVNLRLDALRASTAMVTSLVGFLAVATVFTGEITALGEMPWKSVGWFVAAGLIHFLVGWPVFAISQQRIGASRTASILSVNPVMAAIAAWLVLDEALRPLTWVGVLAVTIGVALVAASRSDGSGRAANPTAALITTACFSVSPLFVRFGLEDFHHPLLGLTVGLAVTTPVMHVVSRALAGGWVSIPSGLLRWLSGGGVAAALAITAQWTAFGLIPVGAAIAIQQISTPVVLFVAPALLRSPAEKPTSRLLAGAGLIVGGAIVVALFGRQLG